jgi:hypothetical protein
MTPSIRSAVMQNAGVMSVTPAGQPIVAELARRRLALPALLFLAAHAPLRIMAGHALLTAAPLAGLVGLAAVDDWAAILNDPDAFASLQAQLEQIANEP